MRVANSALRIELHSFVENVDFPAEMIVQYGIVKFYNTAMNLISGYQEA